MIKLKPLWSKMLYTGIAGIILLFILSFNFKGEENLIFTKNVSGLHKIQDIDLAIRDYRKKDIYQNRDLIIYSKINAYQVNELITKIEADKSRSELRNTRLYYIVENCYDQLNFGDYNNLDKRPLNLLNSSDIAGSAFASDAVKINRNFEAINNYLKRLNNEVISYQADCYMSFFSLYDQQKTNNLRRRVNEIVNLDEKFKSNSAIKKNKLFLIQEINDLETCNYNLSQGLPC